MWIEPEKIMTITLVLITITLGIFILGTIANTNSNIDKYYTESFPITNSSQDQYLWTGENNLINIRVFRYDGVNWSLIPETYWTYYPSKGLIVVESDGL